MISKVLSLPVKQATSTQNNPARSQKTLAVDKLTIWYIQFRWAQERRKAQKDEFPCWLDQEHIPIGRYICVKDNIKRSQYSSGTTSYGRLDYGERKELLMIWSIPPPLMVWACKAASRIGSLVFIYLWCDCWQKQQHEFWNVQGHIMYSYLAKSLDGTSQCRWTMTRSILQTFLQKAKKWNELLLLKLKCPKKNTGELKTAAVKPTPGKKDRIWWCLSMGYRL